MKKTLKFILGFIFSLCLINNFSDADVSATTVGDVIAYARSIGMPEDQIQGYIAQFGGGTYTSEQCDKAIAMLAANKDMFQKPDETEAPETEKPIIYTDLADDEKQDYIANLPDDKRGEVISNMTNDEKADLISNIVNENKKEEILAEVAGCEIAENLEFSVDNISDDAISVIVRDENGNVVNVASFGNAVEKTGVSRTIPLAVGGSLVLLSAAGILLVLKKGDII